jgi:hypothetical protein
MKRPPWQYPEYMHYCGASRRVGLLPLSKRDWETLCKQHAHRERADTKQCWGKTALLRRTVTLALILSLLAVTSGCAMGRSCLVASWEPQPDVRIAYKWEIAP